MTNQLSDNQKAVTALAVLVLTPLQWVFRTFTLMMLWNWFVPSTMGLATVSFWGAAGLAAVASFLTHQINWMQNDRNPLEMQVTIFVHTTAALFFGWLITVCM